MRLHFAAEIILEIINQLFGKPFKIGANISENKARIDFLWEGRISDAFPMLLEGAGKMIHADLPIRSEFSDRETEQRYWEIEGFSKVSCGGTHPKRTGEVGQITLRRNNIGKGKERIEIMLVEPTGKVSGTILNAPVGRHPGQTLAHSSTAKGRGLLLPGYKALQGVFSDSIIGQGRSSGS
jgi:Ser-tRNA(Ala) deacylase AlaX